MKLFGFYISNRDWRTEAIAQTTRADRAEAEAAKITNAWRQSRDELARERSRHDKTIAQMEAARKTHEVEAAAQESRILELEIQREAVEFELQAFQKREKRLLEEIEAYKTMANDKDKKICVLNDYIEELEKANEVLKNAIPPEAQELEKLQINVKSLEQACDNLIDENHEYSTQNDALRIQLGAQRKLLVELQTELETYKKRHEHKVELQRARQKKYKASKKAKALEEKTNTK